jgi:hypothetical protein
VWVGDFWDMFGAGHLLELRNLKAIAEYRHRNGLPIRPAWMSLDRVEPTRRWTAAADDDIPDGQSDRHRYLFA